MDDLKPSPSPLLKVSAFVVRWSLGVLLLAWFMFAAGWGALHLLIVPRIGELRPQLLDRFVDAGALHPQPVIGPFSLDDVTVVTPRYTGIAADTFRSIAKQIIDEVAPPMPSVCLP